MLLNCRTNDSEPQARGHFASTHWSVVLAAGDSGALGGREALERLCQTYWYPLYVYVRRQGCAESDAQDLVQEFFARLLEKKYLRLADPNRGKFRSFLLKSLQHFLVNEWEKARTQKRGGGQVFVPLDVHSAETRYAAEPTQALTVDEIYEKRWAATLIEAVLTRLREAYTSDGRGQVFEALKGCIWGDGGTGFYPDVAARLDLTEGAVKVAVHRLRIRYRHLLRAEVANTVASPIEVDGELRHLMAVLTR